jgi:hypothetical protein
LLNLALFVLSGLAASTGAIFAIADGAAAVALVALFGLVGVQLYRRKSVAGWQFAMVAGVIGWFALVGLGRASRGPGGATDSHYLFIGAVFLLPLIAGLAAELRSTRRWWAVVGIVVATVLAANAWQLRDAALSQTELMTAENAKLRTVETFRGAPDMELDRSLDEVIMPQLKARTYLAAISELGSPVPSSTPSDLNRLPHQPVDEEMVNLFGKALSVGTGASTTSAGMHCQTVDSSLGSTFDFEIPGNQSLTLQATKGGDAFLLLGFLDPPPSVPLKRVRLAPNTLTSVHIPDTGQSTIWRLRIQTLDVGALDVCSAVNPRVSRSDHYADRAGGFTLGPGWSAVADPAASSGRAAMAAFGAPGPQGAFGSGFLPAPGSYDVWYRVRVSQAAGVKEEMTLGVVDIDTSKFLASTTLRPIQLRSAYSWVLVAANVVAPEGHLIRFQANVAARLSTDWFIDGATMVPAGSPAPSS